MAENRGFELEHEPRLTVKYMAFPYQQEAIDFVRSRESCAIFHEQGLGKTKIAIDALLGWLGAKEIDTALVFAKKSLVDNWRREFEQHTYLKPSVITENSRQNYYVLTAPVRVVLTHYEAAKKEEKRLAAWLKTRRVAAVLDEAVKIKNPEADLTQTFFRLSRLFVRRVIMTGTPAANRPYDVWSLVYFLDQGATLGEDFRTFKRETDIPRDVTVTGAVFAAYRRRLAEVQEKLASLSMRETKDGGRVVLPDKEFVRISCRWEVGQFELYRRVREDLRATIMRDGQLLEEDQDVILKRLLRLVQITSNPVLLDESYSEEPGKFADLYDLLSDILRSGEKAIVFTQFNENASWLAKKLRPFGALLLSGKMPMPRRTEAVRWFTENVEDRVLVATTGAAKEGLTLTVANHVVFFDRGYSLDEYLQSQDRIHRVSQTRKCFVYNLIMRNSVDEWIEALVDQKRLAAQVVQGDINAEAYAEKADFSFGELLQRILEP
ncbi:MAG: DEAD/DEAH box helicase [Rhodospirillales bacterium]|nr:DEAD/DEAH box helicase [Rhodospirillales bacterium]